MKSVQRCSGMRDMFPECIGRFQGKVLCCYLLGYVIVLLVSSLIFWCTVSGCSHPPARPASPLIVPGLEFSYIDRDWDVSPAFSLNFVNNHDLKKRKIYGSSAS